MSSQLYKLFKVLTSVCAFVCVCIYILTPNEHKSQSYFPVPFNLFLIDLITLAVSNSYPGYSVTFPSAPSLQKYAVLAVIHFAQRSVRSPLGNLWVEELGSDS